MEVSSTSAVQCKYYLHGACRNGSDCPFSHDLGVAKPQMVCKFYLAGSCTYGASCRYDHIKPGAIQHESKPTPPQIVAFEEAPAPPPLQHDTYAAAFTANHEPDAGYVEDAPPEMMSLETAADLLCPFAAAGRCVRWKPMSIPPLLIEALNMFPDIGQTVHTCTEWHVQSATNSVSTPASRRRIRNTSQPAAKGFRKRLNNLCLLSRTDAQS